MADQLGLLYQRVVLIVLADRSTSGSPLRNTSRSRDGELAQEDKAFHVIDAIGHSVLIAGEMPVALMNDPTRSRCSDGAARCLAPRGASHGKTFLCWSIRRKPHSRATDSAAVAVVAAALLWARQVHDFCHKLAVTETVETKLLRGWPRLQASTIERAKLIREIWSGNLLQMTPSGLRCYLM